MQPEPHWTVKNFEAICPKLYTDTDPARLPAQQLQEVMAWKYGPQGLLLVGPTRTGKTRCAWMLIKRLICQDNPSQRVMAFDSIGWTLAVSKAFGDPANTEDWIEKVSRAPVLYIDDLFKGKLTDAQEMAIYGVLERRAAKMLPTLATTNTTSQMFLNRSTDEADRGAPILERIREFFKIIKFNGAKLSGGSQSPGDVPTSRNGAPPSFGDPLP